MKYVNFPGTQEKVSVIGLGTWVFGGENWGGADDGACVDAVNEAIGLGMNFIDTAPFYTDGKSEQLIGQAIKGKRERILIATKCGLVRENGRIGHNLSPASVERELDQSRSRLGCDVIDLYMCHWPDPNVPVEDTMDALLALREAKKIRHIGVSNFDLELLKRACSVAPIATLQVQYSLLERGIEDELLPFCREKGIGIIAYGAMGGGVLTGKYTVARHPNFNKRDARKMFYTFYEKEKLERIDRFLRELGSFGRPLNQLALNWVRQQEGVMTVLAGCRDPKQVKENCLASDWDLSSEELARLSKVEIFP
jgi:aryl-alcohol dehydrogenase-like predicted oxidoreductase